MLGDYDMFDYKWAWFRLDFPIRSFRKRTYKGDDWLLVGRSVFGLDHGCRGGSTCSGLYPDKHKENLVHCVPRTCNAVENYYEL